MAIHIYKLFKDTLYLLAGSVAGKILNVISGFIVAKVLGPADFGLIKTISYLPSLVKYGSLGFGSVAQREIIHLRGIGDETYNEQKLKNYSYTADIIWSLALSCILVVAGSVFYSDIVQVGIYIVSITLFIETLNRVYTLDLTLQRKFSIISIVGLIGSITNACVVLIAIESIRGYSVFIAGLVASCVSIFCFKQSHKLNFKFDFNFSEIKKQLNIALAFSGGTLSYGLYVWLNRLAVISLLGLETGGLYIFILFIINNIMLVFKTVMRTATIELYERVAKGSIKENNIIIITPTLLIVLSIIFFGGVFAIISPALIEHFLGNYSNIIPSLPFLVIAVALEGAAFIPRTIMNSFRANQQKLFMLQWIFASLLFVFSLWILTDFGLQLYAAIFARIISMLLLLLWGIYSIKNMITVSTQELVIASFSILLPVKLFIIFTLANFTLFRVYHYSVVVTLIAYIVFCVLITYGYLINNYNLRMAYQFLLKNK